MQGKGKDREIDSDICCIYVRFFFFNLRVGVGLKNYGL